MDQLEEFYKDSLEQIPRIGVTALILIPLLRTIILKDALSKVVTLGFALSLACQLNILKAKDIRIIYINNATLIFIGLVAISLIITRIILSASSQRESSDRSSVIYNKKIRVEALVLIVASAVFLVGITLYFLSLPDFQAFLVSSTFYLCVFVILLSLILLYVFDHVMSRVVSEQAIRRKLFHIGPILITPIIQSISSTMLVAILSAGFLVFLALQFVRYGFFQLRSTKKQKAEGQDEQESTGQIQNYLMGFFKWMESFNRREKQFWFTHLFLILSLQLSYSVSLIYSVPGMGHIVLAMIAADAMAALVGKRLGRLKIYQGKTLEGMLAFTLTLYLSIRMLEPFWGGLSYPEANLWVICFGCSCGELFGGDADNIITLLVFYLADYTLR